MNRNILKYAFIGGVAIGAIVAVILLARGGKEESVETGPTQTVEAFCKALTSGRFDEARELCDTVTMDGYIDAFRQEYEAAVRKDSSVAAIAAGMLSQAEITVEDIVKEGSDRKSVFYTVSAGEGMTKEKVAAVVKEEGTWKVAEITDRN